MKLVVALFALLTLVLSGCTKDAVKETICETGKVTATVVAVQVATELGCQNQDAIKADIEKKLVSLKICEKQEESQIAAKSVVGNLVCSSLIEGLFVGAVSNIPANWNCTGGTLAADAKAKLLEACNKAL